MIVPMPLHLSLSCRNRVWLGMIACALCISGCADPGAPESQPPAVEERPSLWHDQNGSRVVGVPDAEDDEEMRQAIAQAHATLEQARRRWAAASEEEHIQWAVKWAAVTVTGDVEHVWVHPLTWSPFRVEGVLASDPIAELACGKTMGELVSFPIEELSDWIHLPDDDQPIEGGFTVKLLESRFGQP